MLLFDKRCSGEKHPYAFEWVHKEAGIIDIDMCSLFITLVLAWCLDASSVLLDSGKQGKILGVTQSKTWKIISYNSLPLPLQDTLHYQSDLMGLLKPPLYVSIYVHHYMFLELTSSFLPP